LGYYRHSWTTRRGGQIATAAAFIALIFVRPVSAQQQKLSTIIPTLFGSGLTIAPGPGGVHARDFVPLVFGTGPNREVQPDVRALALNDAIIEQLPSFPIGSSSGGFTYRFDPRLGTFLRSTRSFGPAFAERAFTGGRGTFAAGVSYQHVDFNAFDGYALDGNDLRFYFRHQVLNEVFNPALTPETSDLLEATLRLRIRQKTVATMLTYGFTDRLDIGVTIPYVETTLDATVNERIIRLGTAVTPTVHSFDGRGGDTTVRSAGGTASGVSDIGMRVKFNVVQAGGGGLAAGLEARFPTGDAENLLGTGTIQSRVYGILSGGAARFSAHVNAGFTMATKQYQVTRTIGEPTDEFDFRGGVDMAVHNQLSASFDVLGRVGVYGRQMAVLTDRQVPYVTSFGGAVQQYNINDLQSGYENMTKAFPMQGVVGVKFNPTRTVLGMINVLFPLSDTGLRNKPALNLGFEYTF
jgi:hypothetical protein